MIAYKGNKAPVVTQGGVVLVKFDGETAEVNESVGEVLKGLGYRVELSANVEGAEPEPSAEAPHSDTEDNGGSEGTVENADTGHKGRGRGVSARNSESSD